MGGLLRTTSRSEYQNFFFSHFIGSSSSLVVFMLQFENSIDSQRHTHRKHDFESSTRRPTLKTPTQMEVQLCDVYTLPIFDDLQTRLLSSAYDCALVNSLTEGDVHYYRVRGHFEKSFVVQHLPSTNEYKCSCNRFLQIGLPCCHMILVIRCVGPPLDVKMPDQYILPRWSKSTTLKPTFEIDGLVFKESVEMDEKKLLVYDVMSEIHSIINEIEHDSDQLKDLLIVLKEKRELYSSSIQAESSSMSNNKTPTKSREARFEKFVGPLPNTIFVLPPPQSKNKGRPKTSRLKSTIEKVRLNSNKVKKCFSICLKSGHNRSTCPENTSTSV